MQTGVVQLQIGSAKLAPTTSSLKSSWAYQPPIHDSNVVKRRTTALSRANNGPLTFPQLFSGDTKGPGGLFGGRKVGVVWLRSALRLHDNPLLQAAAKECTSVVHVYCFDPKDYLKAETGGSRVGPSQAQCLLSCLHDLRTQLKDYSNTLVLRKQEAERALSEIVKSVGATVVYAEEGIKTSDLKLLDNVKGAIQKEGAQLKTVFCDTLVNPKQLPYKPEQLPSHFQAFKSSLAKTKLGKQDATKIEIKGQPIGNVNPGDMPTLESLGFQPAKPSPKSVNKAAINMCETQALQQLKQFLEFAKKQDSKKALPFGLLGQEFARRMSTAMALGCVSSARVLQEATKGAPRLVKSDKKGNGWLHDYLLHRDYAQLTTLKASLKARREAASMPSNGQPVYAAHVPGQSMPAFA